MIQLTDNDRRVFNTARNAWHAGEAARRTRRRLKNYTYGNQWGDAVRDPSTGRICTEAEIIRKSGRQPLTNNLIRRLIKSIVGRYRDMSVTNGWYADTDAAMALDELDSRLMEEFLISGMAVQRVAADNPLDGCTADVTNVSPDKFFCNDFRDPRGRDMDVAGMLHDMSPAEARLRFATTPQDGRKLEHILGLDTDQLMATCTGGESDFYRAAPGRLRVVEVWTREYSPAGLPVWRQRWFAPTGKLLATTASPYRHRGHPFAVRFYPLTDGEIHPFVEDVIDQQRYVNRLIMLADRIMSTSAKGVLLFPVHQKLPSTTWDDIAARWASPDGIIPITGNDDVLPRQVSVNTADSNAHRLIELELKLFDEVSGVSATLMGSTVAGNGTTGANMYQAQVENATIALADIFRTFRAMLNVRDSKLSNL